MLSSNDASLCLSVSYLLRVFGNLHLKYHRRRFLIFMGPFNTEIVTIKNRTLYSYEKIGAIEIT
jgi:hypothetical protein